MPEKLTQDEHAKLNCNEMLYTRLQYLCDELVETIELIRNKNAEHDRTDGSERGDANLEASFLDKLPVLSSDYALELYPVITEPASEESLVAISRGNECEHNNHDLPVTAQLVEGIQAPDEQEDTDMEIQVSDDLEETDMLEDEPMSLETYLVWLEMQLKEYAPTS